MEKNAIDKDEYPMTADLENRCVAMIERPVARRIPTSSPWAPPPWARPRPACWAAWRMLFRWKALAKDAGIDIYTAQRPNLVIICRLPGLLGEVLPLLGHRDAPGAA